MKNIFKLILLLTLFVQSSLVFGQINFTNGGGDKLFSNAANWSGGAVPTAADKIKLDTNGDTIIVDGVYSVKQILATKVKGAIIGTGSGNDTLLINGNSGIGAPIQANGTDARVAFHLPVKLLTTIGTTNKAFQNNGAGSHIKFFDVFINNSGHLTLANPNNRTGTQVHFDGKYISTKWLNINANSKVTFGENSDFTEHKSAVRFTGNAGNGHLTVKSAKDKFKTSDTKVIVNTGGTLIADAENVLSATIQVDTDKVLNLTVNKNQATAGKITMVSGKINLTVDSTVTNLNFADNSSSDWGTGSIVVTGYKDDVIGFGNSNSGITKAQLSQIDAGAVVLRVSSSGMLGAYDISNEKIIITGVLDGDLSGGYPKALELYAVTDIWDLTKYGIDVNSNGSTTASTKPDYYFQSGSLAAGSYYSIGRKSGTGNGGFDDWFGEAADMYTSSNTFNGNDAIALSKITSTDTIIIDVAGAVGTDGAGEAWEYKDGWLYRNHATTASTTFNMDNWTACKGCADTFTSNSTMLKPFPKGTYMTTLPEKLMITGVLDGDLSGGYPKALELYAVTDIADLSKYGIDVNSNGSTTASTKPDYYFESGSLTAGSFYHIGRRSGTGGGGFDDWFGVAADMYTNSNTFNGNDAIILSKITSTDTVIIDVAGAPLVNGSGQPWEYTDGWLYRKNGKEAKTNFAVTDWTACKKCADTFSKNSDMTTPFPYEGYSSDTSPTSVYLQASEGSVDEDAGVYAISVLIADPSPDSATTVHLVYTGSDSTDVGNFVGDTITFPAGSGAAVTVSIPITDDTTPEGEETHTFALQNLSGGYQSALSSPNVFTLTINDNDLGEFNMVFNELHIDPVGDISGDANGDGTRDAIADEFIELVNNGSTAFDLSGYYLTDSEEPNSEPRHVFPQGTVVEAGQAVVVFGGGVPTSPTNFGGAIVHTASENRGGVSLGNSGRTVMVKNPDGLTVLSQAYDGTQGSANQSITRSPDITGGFVSHSGVAASNGALFSPGMKLDSTNFYDHTSTKVQMQLMRSTFKEGTDASFTIGVTINGASATNATTVEVVTTGTGNGEISDIDTYATQTVTFDAGSSATQFVTVNITNDDLLEGNETIEFQLSSASGGENASIGSPSRFMMTLVDDEFGDSPLVLNEVLTDPPSDDAATTDVVEGDANGDGSRHPFDDEFVELVNTSSSQLDISGYSIFDNAGLKHSVPENTVLESGQAFIVFGGGSPTGDFGGAVVQTASSGSISLANGGDKVTVNDNNGNTIIEFEYGGSTPFDGGSDQSLTREPELTGDFILHTTTVAGGVYSPGTKADGSAFDAGVSLTTTVQFALGEFTLANADGSYNLEDYSIEVAISNPSATVATQVEVVFTASDNGTASDINDYVGEVMTFSSGASDSQNSVVKITNANIALGTRYDFALQNISGGKAASIGENSTFTLIVGDPGSVPLSVENDRADITISPNPTTDFINVKINKNKVLENYFVTDISGSRLETREVGRVVDNIKVDARNFDNGLYILGLNFEGESVKLKFIKR